MSVKSGVYLHYKGKKYYVLGVAKHSETKEDMVVYLPLYESDMSQLWVRPLSMFEETIEVDGKKQKRFEFIHS